jgi:transposase
VIPSSVRIFICVERQDMRRSFDRLAAVVEEHLGEDPRSGAMFVFANRRSTRVKVLWFDRNGYCILYKRLHGALFELPTAAGGDMKVPIDPRALGKILLGVERRSASRASSHEAS